MGFSSDGHTPDGHSTAQRTGPLSHVKVLDLTSIIMGPLATQILADMGADVISIESAEGDANRVMGAGPDPQFSGISLNILRNKRSVSFDMRSPDGRAEVLRLAAEADVFVTTLRPMSIMRLGLTYDDIIKVNPAIIYCQAQGFALDSERFNDPAYDDIIQAESGIADLMSRVKGEPSLLPTILADKVCALTIAYSIMAALLEREKSGQGQHVEVPMVDVMRSFMLVEHGSGAVALSDNTKAGYVRILTPHRHPSRTKDGWIHILPYSPEHYEALYREGGRADLIGDPRSASKRATIANSDFLYPTVHSIMLQKTTEDWLAFCKNHQIPVAEVAHLDTMVESLPVADHPTVGQYRQIPIAPKFSRTPPNIYRHAPTIGEHNDEILGK